MKTGFNTLPHEDMGNIIRSGREIKFSLVDEIVAYSTSLDCVFIGELNEYPREMGKQIG